MKRMRFVVMIVLTLGYLPAINAGFGMPASDVTGRDSLTIPDQVFHQKMMELEKSSARVVIEPLSDSLIILALKNQIPDRKTEISIIAVGDIMPGTNYPETSYLPPDPDALFSSSP